MAFVSSRANADTITFSFHDGNDTYSYWSGTLTITGDPNVVAGALWITGVSGTIEEGTFGPVSATFHAPPMGTTPGDTFIDPDHGYELDNLIYTSGNLFDSYGFRADGGVTVFSFHFTQSILGVYIGTTYTGDDNVIYGSASGGGNSGSGGSVAPEPSTLILLGSGTFIVFGAVRKKILGK